MATTALLILAAGKGTRLRSEVPKVLHRVGGDALLGHVLNAAASAGLDPADTTVVTGYAAEQVGAFAAAHGARALRQMPQLGTGHAAQVAASWWRDYRHILIVNGDMPLLSAATLRALRAAIEAEGEAAPAAVLATAEPGEPRAYGRIIRRGDRVVAIVEDRQATAEQKKIRELNAGFYAFQTAPLAAALGRLGNDNPHGEYYLTDVIALMAGEGLRCAALPLENADEILGINDRRELVAVDRLLRRRKVNQLLDEGVTIYYPETVIVDPAVLVGADTILEPGTQLLGRTRVGRDCRVQAYSILVDCVLEERVWVKPHCMLEAAAVGEGAQIGPYTRLREGAAIAAGAHLGNFVEVKKSRVGRGAKAMHLAYLGDSDVSGGVNIGAGTITCNYDGELKHATKIGEGAFVGSNSTLVAPVEIGAGAYIAAGSVITADVPADSLALGRARQVAKDGWAARRRKARAAAKSAPRTDAKR